MTTWTTRTEPTTTWTELRINEGGGPIGLLLALTYSDSDVITTSWTARTEPTTSWTNRIEP